ncbi:MAG: hypothetical protein WC485_06470 [Opitutaceae bacterium]
MQTHALNPARTVPQTSLVRTAWSLALAGGLAGAAAASFGAGVPVDIPGTPMCVTVGGIDHNDKQADEKLEVLRSEGFTSIMMYVFWNKVEKTPGVMDWSEYDADLALYQKHGFKIMACVFLGQWYLTPEFVLKDPKIVRLRCLEHDRDSALPSIWCPRMLDDYFPTFFQKFAEHFLPTGAIESLDIGVSGDYGESIYSVLGNWPGEYHSHPGYWCGDALAVADFRNHVQQLYPGGIGDLNKAWHSSYGSFDEVKPFLPLAAPSERAWQEFLHWYRGAMNDFTDSYLKMVREIFPKTDIYLATGGDMDPRHGSDFSAQAKIAARYGAGVRITNEASAFPMNVRLTRMVDSPCRLYGAYLSHEPAATVTAAGDLGRLFNAVTSGCRQLFAYNSPEFVAEQGGRLSPGAGGKFYIKYKDLLRTVVPTVDVALYYPTSPRFQTQLDRDNFSDLCSAVRRSVDYDFVDDRMIEDGALRGKTALIVASVSVMDAATIERIAEWVRGGGGVFLLDSHATDWDGRSEAFDDLAGLSPQSDEITGISMMHVDNPKALPSIATMPDVYVQVGYTNIQASCEPLLAMEYTAKAKVAWRHPVGAGQVFAYFGPMDLRQREEEWRVARNVPMHFVEDSLASCASGGMIKRQPPTLNLGVPDVYEVEAGGNLWILNMANEARTIEKGGERVQLPPLSIVRR